MKAVKRGDIYHRYFSTTNPPKNKFFVIIGEDSENYVGYFFINSNINKFIERNKEMLDMQLPLLAQRYPFLSHSSFIDGHAIAKIKKNVLIDELSEGIIQIKGCLQKEDMERLCEAGLNSPLFSAKEKIFFK